MIANSTDLIPAKRVKHVAKVTESKGMYKGCTTNMFALQQDLLDSF